MKPNVNRIVGLLALMLIITLALFVTSAHSFSLVDSIKDLFTTQSEPAFAEYSKIKKLNNIDASSEAVEEFLDTRNNYDDLTYEPTINNKPITLLTKSAPQRIKGIKANNKLYAIELLACDYATKQCALRINGVPSGGLKAKGENSKSSFRLDKYHDIEIDSIDFYKCDNKKFCDYYYDAYDEISIKVINT